MTSRHDDDHTVGLRKKHVWSNEKCMINEFLRSLMAFYSSSVNWYDLLPLIFLQGSSIIITKAKFSHDSVNFQFSISNHDVSFKRTFEVILRIIWLDIFYAAPLSDFGVNFIELNYCSVSCHACLEHFGIHSNVRWIPNTRIPSAR